MRNAGVVRIEVILLTVGSLEDWWRRGRSYCLIVIMKNEI
jgi:hypothetical protein